MLQVVNDCDSMDNSIVYEYACIDKIIEANQSYLYAGQQNTFGLGKHDLV